MAIQFGKSITVVSGFDLGAKCPVDTRYTVATIADRDAHVTNNRAYEGMLVYVEEDKTIYKYTGSAWVAFGVTQDTTINISGDVVNTSVTTGTSSAASLTLTLKDIVTAGTSPKVTFNAKGLVTGVEALVEDDIPEIHLAKIVDAGTAAAKDAAESGAGKVLLIGADGKISTDVLPSLALTEVNVVDNESEMLALVAQPGDLAVRNDVERTFILKTAPASVLANWIELKTPTDHVLSVNGKTGSVVLGTDDVAEGTNNLYYTEARATANFTTNFKLANSTDLADTATLVRVGDAIPATVITQDETHRFVTDAQIALWDDAAHITVGTDANAALSTMNPGDFYYQVQA